MLKISNFWNCSGNLYGILYKGKIDTFYLESCKEVYFQCQALADKNMLKVKYFLRLPS